MRRRWQEHMTRLMRDGERKNRIDWTLVKVREMKHAVEKDERRSAT
ncbi:MAG TPA: hypothetical protein VNZ26_01100 [Vicinamibacterales bacterium]|nr:hypothetical protein [Vicinamibacterales bacterium]